MGEACNSQSQRHIDSYTNYMSLFCNMPEYSYVPGENPVFLNDKMFTIGKGVGVHFIVIESKYLEAEREFQALVGVDADHLGPVSESSNLLQLCSHCCWSAGFGFGSRS